MRSGITMYMWYTLNANTLGCITHE